MSFAVNALSDSFGAEIHGLDLGGTIDDLTFEEIKALLVERAVLVFRDQGALLPEQHVAFSRRFGDLLIHPQAKFHFPGRPEILIISNVIENGEPIGLVDAGRYWHSDMSYVVNPSLGSLLHAKEVPDDAGDTIFVDMAAAFDALDPAVQRQLVGLTARHDYVARNIQQSEQTGGKRPALSKEDVAKLPPVEHPVVRVHPVTGRRALFISEGFTTEIVGVPRREGDEILQLLFEHSTAPRFQYRHHWLPHDLVFWDNRSTMHIATGTPPEKRRTLYRTTIAGERPTGWRLEETDANSA